MYGNMNFSGLLGPDFTTWSSRIESKVSAATIPPIECVTRTVRTEGSTVGECVPAATSRSITRVCSLGNNVRIG